MMFMKWFKKQEKTELKVERNSKTHIIDISRESCVATRLWEYMFSEYRQNNGLLDDMHSMLVDYLSCREIVKSLDPSESYKFTWAFYEKCGVTLLTVNHHYRRSDYDHCYYFTITQSKIEVKKCISE